MKIRKNIFVILNLIFAPYLLGSVCADEKTVHTAENTLSSSSVINNFSFKLLHAITKDSTKQKNIVVYFIFITILLIPYRLLKNDYFY